MIRVYIIAAESTEPLRVTVSRRPGDRSRTLHALHETVELRDLANADRMRALATEFHRHFKGQAR